MPVPVFTTGEVLTAANMNAVGLWLVKTQTLSGTSTQVENCFTSDFDSYRVVFSNLTTSTVDNLTIRLVAGTTPNQTANYYSSRIDVTLSGVVEGAASSGATYWVPHIVPNTVASGGSLDIFNPKLSVATTFSATGIDTRVGGAPYRAGGGFFNGTNSFDGLWLSTLNGSYTMGGTVRIYGYRN